MADEKVRSKARSGTDSEDERPGLADLIRWERKSHSQNGEDGVIERLLSILPPAPRVAVEIGVWAAPEGGSPGDECNTRALLDRPGWSVLQFDGAADPDHPRIVREFVTAENAAALLIRHGVPARFALFSLDIDGVDYWVWKALPARFRPQIVIVEYNAMFPDPADVYIVPYDPAFAWDGSGWTGASLGALVELGRQKGYRLVHCTESNAFFVAAEALGGEEPPSAEALYRRKWGTVASPDPAAMRRAWVDGQGRPVRGAWWAYQRWRFATWKRRHGNTARPHRERADRL